MQYLQVTIKEHTRYLKTYLHVRRQFDCIERERKRDNLLSVSVCLLGSASSFASSVNSNPPELPVPSMRMSIPLSSNEVGVGSIPTVVTCEHMLLKEIDQTGNPFGSITIPSPVVILWE